MAGVVLLDLGMPRLTGLQVLECLDNSETPGHVGPAVVVISARDDLESTVAAMRHGAFDYPLAEPFAVVAGEVYTIDVAKTDGSNSGGYCGTTSDTYAGGSVYSNGRAYTPADAAFMVWIDR